MSEASTGVWRKSSYSGDTGGECVEVAVQPQGMRVRDSKNPAGPRLGFPVDAWAEFLGGALHR
ncbi:hypothetical protein GCM10023205_01460 [Yinghuangia aomiensis]|uniref:DUF397 domain-containing protein n=1 Tax=Yinghuangia aomiensis TaxID=676205 RepID=A0ABP9GJ90_9ACTN